MEQKNFFEDYINFLPEFHAVDKEFCSEINFVEMVELKNGKNYKYLLWVKAFVCFRLYLVNQLKGSKWFFYCWRRHCSRKMSVGIFIGRYQGHDNMPRLTRRQGTKDVPPYTVVQLVNLIYQSETNENLRREFTKVLLRTPPGLIKPWDSI